VGNAGADFIAGLTESGEDGGASAVGVVAGSLIPLAPLFTLMVLKRPLAPGSPASYIVGGSSVALLIGTFAHSWFWRKEKHAETHH
jgi:hypothetical protein